MTRTTFRLARVLRPERIGSSTQELLRHGSARRAHAMRTRERAAEGAIAAASLAAGVALAIAARPYEPFAWGTAVGLFLTFLALSRLECRLGAGTMVPTQLVFVPMLLLLPPGLAPLLVAGALVLGRLPEHLHGDRHPSRLIESVGDSWYAVGPALVLTLAGSQGPSWADWPVLLLALTAQFGFDLSASCLREWAARSGRLRDHLPGFVQIFGVDAMLSPVGLLAAFAGAEQPYAWLLVLPAAGAFALFARERGAHVEKALELGRASRRTARLLVDLLEEANEYTGVHSRDVVRLAGGIADELALGPDDCLEVELTALLHDVGKIAVPREILDKPGPLTDEEWALMRTHTVEGERLLEQAGGPLGGSVARAVRASHERWDGSGYPDGLAGAEIPLAARVVSCADTFNAMTTDRPYRAAMPRAEAVRELRASAALQLDPDVVAAAVTALAKEGAIESEHAQAAAPEPSHERSDASRAAQERFRYPSMLGELQANADQIAALAEATRALARSGEPNPARAAVCTAALDVTGASGAALFELGDDGGLVETARAGVGAAAGVQARPLPPLLAERRFLPDASEGPLPPGGFLSGVDAVSALVEPLIREGALVGVIVLVWTERLERLPESIGAMMRLLAAESALALARTELLARLHQVSGSDELPGVLSGEAWHAELERELIRARRKGAQLSVVVLALDGVLDWDGKGRAGAGDRAASEAASAWLGELRLSDHLGRHSRDGFMALLPGCSSEDALNIAGRLAKALPGDLTCFCGAATWDGSEEAAQLGARAREALSAARLGGRTGIVAAA